MLSPSSNSIVSRSYWRMAASEFKSTKMRVFAAILIALRIVLKSVAIPIGPELKINIAFFINAYGSMIYGPVVAIVGAAISDTLGWVLFPSGPYFFPFIFTEIAGSLIFALFFYRRDFSAKHVILSRFCIDFFVNIVMNTPIMWLYYRMVMGKSYVLFDGVRIAKNLVMFPIESVLLILFFRLVIPATRKIADITATGQFLKLTRKHVALLSALLLVGVISAGGYMVYQHNHTSLSASYSSEERLSKNLEMKSILSGKYEQYGGDEWITVIESAYNTLGSKEVYYTVAVYKVNQDIFLEKEKEDSSYTLARVQGYSKSKAAADNALERERTASIILDKNTKAVLSVEMTTQAAGKND